MKKFFFVIFILFFILSSSVFPNSQKNKNIELSSPDKKIKIIFFLNNKGKPTYKVFFKNYLLINESTMGFLFKETSSLINNFKIYNINRKSYNKTWKPIWGQRNLIRNNYKQLRIGLYQNNSIKPNFTILFRAFNDGIAFRYIIPEQINSKRIEIISEQTYFNFVKNFTSWWIPGNWNSYEKLYRKTKLNEIKKHETSISHFKNSLNLYQKSSVSTPFTLKTTNNLYLSIHEANLRNYAGMKLQANNTKLYSFKSFLVPCSNGIKVKSKLPLKTPWRTIIIAESPGGLIESNLILNLNPPCKIKDTSWIKPMKYLGIWWGMHIGKYTWHIGPNHGATTDNAYKYIDFASKQNISGLLIEGWNQGWESWGKNVCKMNFVKPYSDFKIKEIVRYGSKKNVNIIGHLESGGNVPVLEKQLDDIFSLYQSIGINTVKTGYAGKIIPWGEHHHGQYMVNHFQKVIEKAAKYNIMIDAHESIKPTGIYRTYPNFLTRECVRGMEYNAWSEGNPPEHTTILPFTRMLAGPLDYTPGIFDIHFDKYRKKERVHTTLAKQLALYVVLYSPLQMAADLIENYRKNPEPFKFIKNIPVSWDRTKVLESKIGDYVIISRKKDRTWYIGCITDEKPRLLKIPLDFLENNKKYIANIYYDSSSNNYKKNPDAVSIDNIIINNKDIIITALAFSGGTAIKINPFSYKIKTKTTKNIKDFNNYSKKRIKIFSN